MEYFSPKTKLNISLGELERCIGWNKKYLNSVSQSVSRVDTIYLEITHFMVHFHSISYFFPPCLSFET